MYAFVGVMCLTAKGWFYSLVSAIAGFRFEADLLLMTTVAKVIIYNGMTAKITTSTVMEIW
jgi:hypothetical protein